MGLILWFSLDSNLSTWALETYQYSYQITFCFSPDRSKEGCHYWGEKSWIWKHFECRPYGWVWFCCSYWNWHIFGFPQINSPSNTLYVLHQDFARYEILQSLWGRSRTDHADLQVCCPALYRRGCSPLHGVLLGVQPAEQQFYRLISWRTNTPQFTTQPI